MLYLKISFGKEIHLLTKEANYTELIRFIRESFKNLPGHFEITYRDADGDNISISNDEDVHTLYATSTEKFVKINILALEDEPVAEPEVAPIPKQEIKPEIKVEAVPEVQVVADVPVVSVPEVRPVEVIAEIPKPVEQLIKQPVQAPTEEIKPVEPEIVVEAKVEEVKPPVEEVKEQIREPVEEKKEKSPGDGCRGKWWKGRGHHGGFPGSHQSPPCPAGFQPPPFFAGRPDGERPEGCPFPGKEFFRQKLDELVTKKVNDLLPCIVNKVRIELQGGKVESAPVAPETVVHRHVRCDGCGKNPLTGIRYKCYECPDFDFCEECEAKLEHPHSFIKIKKPVEGCPWKAFRRNSPEGERPDWKHGGHHGGRHGGHHGPWAAFGRVAKCAFKLSKHFGGDPEIYREFVEKNQDKRCHELKDLYIAENKTSRPVKEFNEERIAKRSQKLAFIFRRPASSFVEIVKKNPEMKAWQLVELIRAQEAAPAEKKVSELKPEVAPVVEAVKVEEVKPIVFVKQITDEDLTSSNLSIPKKESVAEVIKPVAEVKAEVPKLNKLDEKEVDYSAKLNIIMELITVAGEENDYVDFVRKNYKIGAEQCLNAWFESHN